jgi:hypothetical protein
MNRAIGLNVLMNAVLAAAFVLLNARALSQGLEETFVALALLYGLAAVGCNAAYVAAVVRGRH